MMLVHASISENNNAGWDGKARPGDQTGKEVCVRSFYNKGWEYLLIHPDVTVRKKASAGAVKLANSNLVGYDQSGRNTLYQTLKKYRFDIDAYIKSGEKTECDCSSFVYAVFACFLPNIRSDSNGPVTTNMRKLFTSWGFKCLSFTPSIIAPGDILLKEKGHTAIVTDGKTSETAPVNMVEIPQYTDAVNDALTVIAKDVIAGKWGNGAERKESLYTAIQTRVNELLKG